MTNNDIDTAAVAGLASGFTQAWNTHDMEAFGKLFATDAEFVNVAGMWWRGRREIQGAHTHTHATFFRQSTLSGEVASVKFLSPDVGLVHMTWRLVGHLDPGGRVADPRNGVLVLTAVRDGDGWKIAAAQNTNELPEARARMASRA